ncbi:MAG: hypothetical protein JW736_02455 [Deltaproteobacteria bacterium]|nr:hypothetical protein [Deltaproteobacteria bacterium]MBN2688952.1 hypothetical protein [Deltaproteobacteria bacterium]
MTRRKASSAGMIKHKTPPVTDSSKQRYGISNDTEKLTEGGLPNVVVMINEGKVQHIVAATPVEAYIFDCDTHMTEKKEAANTFRICGLPDMISKSRNVIAPSLVSKVNVIFLFVVELCRKMGYEFW